MHTFVAPLRPARHLLRLASALATLSIAPLGYAATYYVSPTGNNNNNGTVSTSPWQTLAKVNATTFAAGDTILFQGGQTFAGTLTPRGNGTSAARITFGSYGTGRATLDSAASGGLVLNGNDYLTIQDLAFRGNWQNTAYTAVQNAANIAIGARLYGTVTFIDVLRCEVSGYGSFGLEVQTASNQIRVLDSALHDNKDTGIEFRSLTGKSRHQNVRIADTRVYKNRGYATPNSSGNGIRLAKANGAVIDRCVAWENGKECTTTGGGPVGIWSWQSNNVVIQNSIAYRNGNAGSYDGGGFDIDGGNTNCLLQYNYSFENEGAGYLVAAYQGSTVRNAVIRYNVSINDATLGTPRNQGSIHIWNAAGNAATAIQDVFIYGNTVVQSVGPDCLRTADSAYTNVQVSNNLFLVANGCQTTNIQQTSGVTLRGNLYHAADATANPRIVWGGASYASLPAFRSATGQETLSAQPVGLNVDPLLAGAALTGPAPFLTNPATLAADLAAYRLQTSSPAIDAGLNLATLLGTTTTGTGPAIAHPGPRDFFGTTVKQLAAFDIGAHESTSYAAAAPVITAEQTIYTVIGTPFSHALQASANPTSWTLVSGAVPAGVSFNSSTGTLAGTPPAAASATLGFTATNATGTSAAQTVAYSANPPDALLAYEAFDYPAGAGQLAGKTGGIGFPSAWDSGANAIATPGSTYASGADTLAVAGARAVLQDGVASHRALPSLYSNGTYWLAFIARSNAPGSFWGGVSLFQGSNERLFIGQRYAAATWGLERAGGTGVSSSASSGTSSFIVVKIVLKSGADDIYLWVNPSLAAAPADSAATQLLGVADFAFDRLRLQHGLGAGQTLDLDEIQLGGTFRDVAPLAP